MLKNATVTAFTVFELLRENQQRDKVTPPPPPSNPNQIRVKSIAILILWMRKLRVRPLCTDPKF